MKNKKINPNQKTIIDQQLKQGKIEIGSELETKTAFIIDTALYYYQQGKGLYDLTNNEKKNTDCSTICVGGDKDKINCIFTGNDKLSIHASFEIVCTNLVINHYLLNSKEATTSCQNTPVLR